MSSASLISQYKSQLRSLNPSLPQVIEHLVATEVLTRSEASKLRSTSNQFAHLCEQLASKGTDSRDKILAEIASFNRGQKRTGEKGGAVCGLSHCEDLPVSQPHQPHRKHILNGRAAEERCGGNRKRESGETGERKREEQQRIKLPEMDRFIPQFYTLIFQLLQSLSVGSGSRWSHDESGDPLISEWLQADLNVDQLLSYFPSHLRKSLVSHSHSTGGGRRTGKNSEGVFKSVSISELLAHFKSYVRRHEAEARERKLLTGKTKLLESLTERNAHLEEQVLGMSRAEIPDSHQLTNGHPPHHQNGTTGHSTTLEKREGEEVKKMLRKSNAHVEELLVTNNQWAIEAGERTSDTTVLQIQLQDAQKEIQRLRKTRHTTAPSVVGGAGITRSEFSSNGDVVDTNSRTEQEKQLKQERDVAVRENERLKAELAEERRGREEDRDEIEELRDRVANLRVQATSKMPTVKELTALSGENRQLREMAERDKAQIEALVQKLKILQKKVKMQHSSDLSSGVSYEGSLSNEAATNQSGVLVEPLAKDDDLACFNGVGNSPITTTTAKARAGKRTPIFIDDTPMAPKKPPFSWDTQAAAPTLHNGTSNHRTTADHTTWTQNFPAKSSDGSELKRNSGSQNPPRSRILQPPSPNQPEAVIVSRVRFGCETERTCPQCSTVFLTLGEAEFQSHVARCQLPPL